jgi:hypothetical protein
MRGQLAPIGTARRCVKIQCRPLQRLAHVAAWAAGRSFVPGLAM